MNWSASATFITTWVVLLWQTDATLSLVVKINPEHIHDNYKDPISVRCQTEHAMPITDCQFRVWFVGKRTDGALLNATDGDSVKVENTSPEGTYSAHFLKDFPAGVCNVSLQGVPGNHLLVGCKLATASNETAVKTTSIFRTDKTRLSLGENNHQSFVRAGDNVNILAEGYHEEFGAKAVTVIVTQPPTAIELSLYTEPEGFTAGDSITATCSVHGVRQPDKLNWTWTIGGETLRNASKGYSNPAWSWPWQNANVSQSLTFTLKDEHDGQYIGCHVEGLNDTLVLKFLVEPVAAKAQRHLIKKVTGTSVAMLLLILVVAVVAVAAVRRRACFTGQQYTDLKSQTPKDNHLRRVHPPRAAILDVHPTNGRRPNNQQLPAPNRGHRPPVTASNAARSAPRVAPQKSSQTQVAQPARAAPRQAGLKKVNKEDGNTAATRQKVELPDVQYVNATALGLNHTKVDDEDVEYLNVAVANVASQKNLPQTSKTVVPKEHGKTKQSVDRTQRAQPPAPVPSQQAPHRLPRATAAVRPMPRPAVTSQELPLIRGKEDDDQVVYAELRLPAVRRTAPTVQDVEVDYAELDWSK